MKQLALVFCSIFGMHLIGWTQSCKVSLASIAGTYEGSCQKDKANGKGKSTGTDSYEGDFKNGYPDGFGKYTWANGNWFEGNFKQGKRQGEGTMHYKEYAHQDSILTGFWTKDNYIGKYENAYTIKSKSFLVKSVDISTIPKQEPVQIEVNLSNVGSGTEDTKGTLPKPFLSNIDVVRGNFQQRTEITNMDKRNTYTFTHIQFPFFASFKIGNDEVSIEFYNAVSYKVDVVMSQ